METGIGRELTIVTLVLTIPESFQGEKPRKPQQAARSRSCAGQQTTIEIMADTQVLESQEVNLEELDLASFFDQEFEQGLLALEQADQDGQQAVVQEGGQEGVQEGVQETGQEVPTEEALPQADVDQGEQAYEGDDMAADEQGDDGGDAGQEMQAPAEEAEAASLQTERDAKEALRNQRIIASMSEAQLDRYEAYRRSALPRNKMKKLLGHLLNNVAIGDRALIAMCGIGKMFVGDLIELARHIAATEGHTGPLLPRHVQRAYQVLDSADRIPHAQGSKKRLWH